MDSNNLLRLCAHLPPEMWSQIIDFLPRADQRSCLFVSRVFHEFALARLFAHVIVYFGLWTANGENRPSIPWTEKDYEDMDRLNLNSWQVLHHISRTPAFARFVKKLSVRAFSISTKSSCVW